MGSEMCIRDRSRLVDSIEPAPSMGIDQAETARTADVGSRSDAESYMHHLNEVVSAPSMSPLPQTESDTFAQSFPISASFLPLQDTPPKVPYYGSGARYIPEFSTLPNVRRDEQLHDSACRACGRGPLPSYLACRACGSPLQRLSDASPSNQAGTRRRFDTAGYLSTSQLY